MAIFLDGLGCIVPFQDDLERGRDNGWLVAFWIRNLVRFVPVYFYLGLYHLEKIKLKIYRVSLEGSTNFLLCITQLHRLPWSMNQRYVVKLRLQIFVLLVRRGANTGSFFFHQPAPTPGVPPFALLSQLFFPWSARVCLVVRCFPPSDLH